MSIQRLKLTGAAILVFPSFNVEGGPGCSALAFSLVAASCGSIQSLWRFDF
jgi:hypothetical protein